VGELSSRKRSFRKATSPSLEIGPESEQWREGVHLLGNPGISEKYAENIGICISLQGPKGYSVLILAS
jgi:hypothetical protein